MSAYRQSSLPSPSTSTWEMYRPPGMWSGSTDWYAPAPKPNGYARQPKTFGAIVAAANKHQEENDQHAKRPIQTCPSQPEQWWNMTPVRNSLSQPVGQPFCTQSCPSQWRPTFLPLWGASASKTECEERLQQLNHQPI